MNRPRQVAEPVADIPPVATGTMLRPDPMTQLAELRHHDAPVARVGGGGVPAPPHPPADPIVPVAIRHASNDGWAPGMVVIPLGRPVEILPRDDTRQTVDVTHQTAAITGDTATLFLFADEQQAANFADDQAANQAARLLQGGVRAVVLPDGAGRTFTHTASVWAVAYGAAGGYAVIDLSIERKNPNRRYTR